MSRVKKHMHVRKADYGAAGVTPPRPLGQLPAGISAQDYLVDACVFGSLRRIIAACDSGARVTRKGRTRTGEWYYPIEAAAAQPDSAVIVFLLSRGADPNGGSAMYRAAAYHGCVRTLRVLIDAGGDVNVRHTGQVAVETALTCRSLPQLRLLLAQPDVDLTRVPDSVYEGSACRNGAGIALLRQEVRWCVCVYCDACVVSLLDVAGGCVPSRTVQVERRAGLVRTSTVLLQQGDAIPAHGCHGVLLSACGSA